MSTTELYISKDRHVIKTVHESGVETAIKTTPAIGIDGIFGNVTNKFNVFVSSSLGCKIGCKFCYLTTKKCEYKTLSSDEIVEIVLDALKLAIKEKPELKSLYLKLSSMGMGDPCSNITRIIKASDKIIQSAITQGLTVGLDGVDISTTLPKRIDSQSITEFNKNLLIKYKNLINPSRNYFKDNKSIVRFFYSLHSPYDNIRKKLIPISVNIQTALNFCDELNTNGITTIIHYLLFNGVTEEEIEDLYGRLINNNLKDIEVRILRFNRCEGTSYRETENIEVIISKMLSLGMNIKVQSSPGSEVKAACGQFLLSRIK
jgi:adenine C2-methylase RlmN of 23S rRNA A2503 and tRNA A37